MDVKLIAGGKVANESYEVPTCEIESDAGSGTESQIKFHERLIPQSVDSREARWIETFANPYSEVNRARYKGCLHFARKQNEKGKRQQNFALS